MRKMQKEKIIWNQFTTKYAIDDPIEGLIQLNENIESYKKRYKKIINSSLLISLFYFSFVIISVLLIMYGITNILLLSQSFSSSYFFESGLDLFFYFLSLPFSTIVILFLSQSWKFYEVLVNRIQTINKVWDEQSFVKNTEEHDSTWNPMDINVMILGEMEDYIHQVKKQILISIICLSLTSIIILIPAVIHIFFNPIIFNFNFFISVFIPIFLLCITLFIIPFLFEIHRFVTWQYQQYNVIDAVYSNPPPITDSASLNLLTRLKSYLKKDSFVNKNQLLQLNAPFIIENIRFDSGGKTDHTFVFVRKCHSVTPSTHEIQQFHTDIQYVISKQVKKPEYIRAMLLCDWREEEADLSENIEQEIFKYPILLKKKGGVEVVTYIQIIMDTGSMYSMFPLVPEKRNG